MTTSEVFDYTPVCTILIRVHDIGVLFECMCGQGLRERIPPLDPTVPFNSVRPNHCCYFWISVIWVAHWWQVQVTTPICYRYWKRTSYSGNIFKSAQHRFFFIRIHIKFNSLVYKSHLNYTSFSIIMQSSCKEKWMEMWRNTLSSNV